MEAMSPAASGEAASRPSVFRRALHEPSVVIGGIVLILVVLIGIFAPYLGTIDPAAISPAARNKLPGAEYMIRTDTGERMAVIARFGTDGLGRDVYSRVLYGARASVIIGFSVATISILFGLMIGLVAGIILPFGVTRRYMQFRSQLLVVMFQFPRYARLFCASSMPMLKARSGIRSESSVPRRPRS